jgi:hypothetical protein
MTIATSAATGDPLLAPKAAALVLGLSVSWLAKARLRGDGPRFVKVWPCGTPPAVLPSRLGEDDERLSARSCATFATLCHCATRFSWHSGGGAERNPRAKAELGKDFND